MQAAIDESNSRYCASSSASCVGPRYRTSIRSRTTADAANARVADADRAIRERRLRLCRTQFLRVFEHLRNIVEPVEEHIGLQGKRALDFGCGTGALSVALALKGRRRRGCRPDACIA